MSNCISEANKNPHAQVLEDTKQNVVLAQEQDSPIFPQRQEETQDLSSMKQLENGSIYMEAENKCNFFNLNEIGDVATTALEMLDSEDAGTGHESAAIPQTDYTPSSGPLRLSSPHATSAPKNVDLPTSNFISQELSAQWRPPPNPSPIRRPTSPPTTSFIAAGDLPSSASVPPSHPDSVWRPLPLLPPDTEADEWYDQIK